PGGSHATQSFRGNRPELVRRSPRGASSPASVGRLCAAAGRSSPGRRCAPPPEAHPPPPHFPPPADVVKAFANGAAPPPVRDSAPPGGPSTPKAIQLYNAYLVLETPQGMLVIDQHALHERILFEHWKSRIRAGNLETQPLLIPEPVELTVEQAARTLEYKSALALLG